MNSPASRPLSKALIVRFLNFGIDQIAQRDVYSLAHAGDESELYFISRQLTELATRYQIDRLGELQRYLISAGYESTCEESIDPGLLEVSAPSDITRDAREATDEIATQRALCEGCACVAESGRYEGGTGCRLKDHGRRNARPCSYSNCSPICVRW